MVVSSFFPTFGYFRNRVSSRCIRINRGVIGYLSVRASRTTFISIRELSFFDSLNVVTFLFLGLIVLKSCIEWCICWCVYCVWNVFYVLYFMLCVNEIEWTHVSVATCSAGPFVVNRFFTFLIRSRDKRSPTNLLLSLMFTDDVPHSRNIASIRFDGCAEN